MSKLAQLSSERLGPLPKFPGSTIPEQLDNGMRQAAEALRKHVSGFDLDVNKAEQDISYVNAWAERNQSELTSSMEAGSTLPEQIALKLTPEAARNFVVAIFVTAVAGLGPWRSGALSRAVDEQLLLGQHRVTNEWAIEDAQYRLQVFGSIVKLEQEGKLKDFFEPNAAMSGFGVAPSVVALIVLLALVLVAAVVVYLILGKQLELNNKMMADLCSRAQEQGDTDTVRECVAALKSPDPWRAVAVTAAVIGVSYVGVRYGLPALLSAVDDG